VVYVPPLTYGQVLYDNVLIRNTAVSYDGTAVAGFGFVNAYDWADWSLFLTELGPVDRRLTFSLPYGSTFDTFAIMVVPFNTVDLPDEAVIGLAIIGQAQIAQSNGSCAVSIELETGPGTGVYNTIASKTITGTEALWYVNLPALYAVTIERVRVRFVNASGSQLVVRDMALGRRLTFDMGQHADIAPPSLTGGVVITNSVSVNGSLLGRQTRRVEKSAEIALDPVKPAWVRTYWEPFAKAAVKRPFYYSWNYANYPGDSCLVTATNVEQGKNASPPGTMSVNMPLRVIQ
jgi:hypothetical protein